MTTKEKFTAKDVQALRQRTGAGMMESKKALEENDGEMEKRIFVEQVKESGKPDHLIEKIVAGKVEAYYKDVALVHQAWVREPKKTIGDLIKEASAKVGENIQVRRFVRFQMGEE